MNHTHKLLCSVGNPTVTVGGRCAERHGKLLLPANVGKKVWNSATGKCVQVQTTWCTARCATKRDVQGPSPRMCSLWSWAQRLVSQSNSITPYTEQQYVGTQLGPSWHKLVSLCLRNERAPIVVPPISGTLCIYTRGVNRS
jgi:hypothetical protein